LFFGPFGLLLILGKYLLLGSKKYTDIFYWFRLARSQSLLLNKTLALIPAGIKFTELDEALKSIINFIEEGCSAQEIKLAKDLVILIHGVQKAHTQL
jgi:hypothetical protein